MIVKVDELIKKELCDEVLIFETDTVYGLGCKLDSYKAIQRIYDIKKRDHKLPLAILCADLKQVKTLVSCDESYLELGIKHWPGALTLVLPKSHRVGDFVTSNFDTVALRIPDNEVTYKILRTYGPMAVTSLNLSTEKAILKYNDALLFEDCVDYIVEGKDLKGESSTVYDPVHDILYRQGEKVIT